MEDSVVALMCIIPSEQVVEYPMPALMYIIPMKQVVAGLYVLYPIGAGS